MNLTEKQKKSIVDTVTILLLIAAFALAFYTGLVGNKSSGEPMLALNVFSIIAVVGSLVMMGVGGISEMSTTDLKLDAVAAQCGLCHSSYLIRTFRSVTGVTPHAFRAAAQG